MNLDLALVEKDRRDGIVVLRVDRRDLLVDSRFAHAGDAQDAPHDAQAPGAAGEPLRNVVLKHRMHLAWWTGQEHDRRAVMIDEHAGRSAVWIRQGDRV